MARGVGSLRPILITFSYDSGNPSGRDCGDYFKRNRREAGRGLLEQAQELDMVGMEAGIEALHTDTK